VYDNGRRPVTAGTEGCSPLDLQYIASSNTDRTGCSTGKERDELDVELRADPRHLRLADARPQPGDL
jgi:hypothetical protein